MRIELWIITAVTLYKIVSLILGGLFAYWGYKLFVSGVWGNAGDLTAKYSDTSIEPKKGTKKGDRFIY